MKKITIYFLYLFSVSCTNQVSSDLPDSIKDIENLTVYSLDTEPLTEIEFIREQVYTDSDDVVIGNIMGIVVDEQGRVFVADNQQLSILVFNPDGELLTTIGREGRGPGEFQDISGITANGEHLYIFDDMLKRVNVFSMEFFTFSSTFPLNSGDVNRVEQVVSLFTRLYVLNDNRLLVQYEEYPLQERMDGPPSQYRHYYLSETGEFTSDAILQLPATEHIMSEFGGEPGRLSAPFLKSTLMAVSPNGEIYTAWSDEFLIKVYDSEGIYLRSVYYPYENAKLDEESFIEQLELNQIMFQMYESADYPELWPALHYMFIDDEKRLWVSTINSDENNYTWLILSSEGSLLSTFNWPGKRLDRNYRNPEIIEVKEGKLYVREVSSTGGQEIVRYRFEL